MKTKFLVGLLIAGMVLIGGCVQEKEEVKEGVDCLARDCFRAGCVKWK